MKDMVMIIGAGVFQVPAIKIAKEIGLKVLSTDMDKNAPGVLIADYFKQASTQSPEENINAALKYKDRLKGVLTIGTDISYTVACTAKKLGLPGIEPEIAYKAQNKGEMRKCFKQHGVSCPEFIIAENIKNVISSIDKLSFPVVIKPVDNMGARGVKKLENINELKEQFDITKKYSKTGFVIIEEFMDGPELSVDTLVYDGKVHFLTCADRHINFPPYFVETGHSIPSLLSEETIKQVKDVMVKAIKAVGITIGASKADIKVTSQGPKIGEITARMSGGFHCQFTDPLSTGMNSIKAVIDIACGNGLDIDDITPKFNKSAVERAVIPKPGKVVSITGVSEAQKIKGVEHIVINVKPGDIIEKLTSNIGKAGHIIAVGNDRKEAENIVNKALGKIVILTN